jgi:Tfp pilus assembly protein PilX
VDKAGQRSRATENQISASTYPSPTSSALRAAERDVSSCTHASAAIEATAIAAPLRDAICVHGIATLRQGLRSALKNVPAAFACGHIRVINTSGTHMSPPPPPPREQLCNRYCSNKQTPSH